MRPMFMFPATAVILLRTRTWMSDVAITCWLRNYGAGGHSAGQPFWVNTRRPTGFHYEVRVARGGFLVTPCAMRGPAS